MTPRASGRSSPCTRAEASTRPRQAEALVLVADLALSDETSTTTPGVAAALAVLAGIAASDAACCAALGQRRRGQDHRQAVELLETVEPGGPDMAKHLRSLLAAKDDAHYGLQLVGRSKAEALIRRADALFGADRAVVEG